MSVSVGITSQLLSELLRMYGLEGLNRVLKSEPTVDQRLQKLAKIQQDLADALRAVSELQTSAQASKREALQLESEVVRLRQDRIAAEELVRVPEEAFARLLSRASAKGRGRGLLEGVAVGLLTGFASSWLVWYITAR